MKRLALLAILFLGIGSSWALAQDMALKTNLLYDATTTINLGYEVSLNRKTTLDIWVNYNPWTLGHKMVGLDDEAVKDITGLTYTGGTASYRDTKLKHLMIQPEVRWWLCEKFNGHFFGVHLHGGLFNVGGLNVFGLGNYNLSESGKRLLMVNDLSEANFNSLTEDEREKYFITGVQYQPGTRTEGPYEGIETPEPNDFLWRNADRDGIYTNTFEGWFVGLGVSYGYHLILNKRLSMEFTIGLGYAYLNYEKTRCTDCRKKLGEGTSHYFGPTRAGVSLVYMLK